MRALNRALARALLGDNVHGRNLGIWRCAPNHYGATKRVKVNLSHASRNENMKIVIEKLAGTIGDWERP